MIECILCCRKAWKVDYWTWCDILEALSYRFFKRVK